EAALQRHHEGEQDRQGDERADQDDLVERICPAKELDSHVVERKEQHSAHDAEHTDDPGSRLGIGRVERCHALALPARSRPVCPARDIAVSEVPSAARYRAAARSARSSAAAKRARSALAKARPPPCRNGSAARRSAIRSRVASALPMLAGVSALPSCLSTPAPAATHFAARGMSAVTTTSPGPARSAIHLSASSGPSVTKTTSTSGCAEGRSPPLQTRRTRTP